MSNLVIYYGGTILLFVLSVAITWYGAFLKTPYSVHIYVEPPKRKEGDNKKKVLVKPKTTTLSKDVIAHKWHIELSELGEDISVFDLKEYISETEKGQFDRVAFKAVFNENEYMSLMKKLIPGIKKENMDYAGYENNFDIERIPSALYVKKISRYIDKLEENIIFLKENMETIKQDDRKKLKYLKELKSIFNDRLLEIAKISSDNKNNTFKIVFSELLLEESFHKSYVPTIKKADIKGILSNLCFQGVNTENEIIKRTINEEKELSRKMRYC